MIRFRSIWRRKILWPLWSLAALVLAVCIAAQRAQRSSIVIYNEGREPLVEVEIRAGQQVHHIGRLGPDQSRRWRMGASGEAGGLRVDWLNAPFPGWDGGMIDPLGGDRITLRIYSDGSVVQDHQRTIWVRP